MKKILIVHAQKEFHEEVLRNLPKDKYRCVSAFDGIEGLHKFRNEDFDFGILHVEVTKVDVMKFWQHARELQLQKKKEPATIYIVGPEEVVTANRFKLDKTEVLPLPLNASDLLKKMEKPKAETSRKSLAPGEVLFSAGDSPDNIYYLVSGKLSCLKGKSVVGHVLPGELVGEMSLINKDVRSLTVQAAEASELLVIPGDKILSVVGEQPKWIQIIIENLSRRLKETLKQIS